MYGIALAMVVYKQGRAKWRNCRLAIYVMYVLVAAAEIRDHETGLVSGPFFWFQSRQLFPETHETEANSTSYLSILTLSILYYVQTYYF